MKKQILKTILLSLTFAMVHLPTMADNAVAKKTTKIKLSESFWFFSSEVEAEDDYFLLVWDKDGKINIKRKDTRGNIRDFTAFTTALYREVLFNKLKLKQPLSRGEFEVLKLCIRSQVALINNCSVAFLHTLINDKSLDKKLFSDTKLLLNNQGNENKLIEVEKRVSNATLNVNSLPEPDALFSKIKDFANLFGNAPKDILTQDIENIYDAKEKDLGYITFGFEDKKAVDGYDPCRLDPQNTAMLWQNIHRSIDYYKDDLRAMHSEIANFRKEVIHSTNIKDSEDLLLKLEKDMRRAILINDMLFNDLPLVIAANKALSSIYSAKSWRGDDETKMKEAVSKFIVTTSSPEMLKNIRSPYSSRLYTQMLNKFKSELWAGEWEEYKLSTKIYNLDSLSSDVLKQNKVSQVKEGK